VVKQCREKNERKLYGEAIDQSLCTNLKLFSQLGSPIPALALYRTPPHAKGPTPNKPLAVHKCASHAPKPCSHTYPTLSSIKSICFTLTRIYSRYDVYSMKYSGYFRILISTVSIVQEAF